MLMYNLPTGNTVCLLVSLLSLSWPKIHIYIAIHQNVTLFLQETVKLQEKGREPKMQFNTQFQAHYLSLSINLAMVQKVAHNSLKCWLNSSRLQCYSWVDTIVSCKSEPPTENSPFQFYVQSSWFLKFSGGLVCIQY